MQLSLSSQTGSVNVGVSAHVWERGRDMGCQSWVRKEGFEVIERNP